MNSPARPRSKVFEDKNVPLDDIVGCVCAWDGCTTRFGGSMPKGWINLLTYWSKRPEPNFLQIPPQDIWRDAVLCPEHARALQSHLKDFR
jgi:hypothetical protein